VALAKRWVGFRAKCFGLVLGAASTAVTSLGRAMARGAGAVVAACIGVAAGGAVGLAGSNPAQRLGNDGGTGNEAARSVPTAPIATTGSNHRPNFISCLAKSPRPDQKRDGGAYADPMMFKKRSGIGKYS
jgi:hypothetical protein